MQIRWNASSFKKSYAELFKLEQYKLSGKITRQQSGSASILRDTYIYLFIHSFIHVHVIYNRHLMGHRIWNKSNYVSN